PGALVRPNRLLGGGGSLYVENAITHPSWFRERHARTCLKSPPRSPPFFTVTSPPSRTADTRRLRAATLPSISSAISLRSTKVPCEWLTRITPRPWLYFRRYVRHASRTSA